MIRCRDARQRRAERSGRHGDETDVVEPVTIDSPDGLDILRHSTAHRARAGRAAINPEAKLGIGPPVTDGFYYDFDVAEPFTPEDLKALDKEMARIIRSGQRFVRRVVTDDEARAELADEPYKLELIGLKGTARPPSTSRSASRSRSAAPSSRSTTTSTRRPARWSGRTSAAGRTCRTRA